MTYSISNSAKDYLKMWKQGDRDWCDIFKTGKYGWDKDRSAELKTALGPSARYGYNVARTLGTKYDIGKNNRRYEPIFKIVDPIKKSDVVHNPVEMVCHVALALERIYKKYPLSAASKILWLKFKSPIIIYDSRVYSALKLRSGIPSEELYKEFCKKWRHEFSKNKDTIDSACKDLAKKNHNEQDDIVKGWFKERVLDRHLFNNENSYKPAK